MSLLESNLNRISYEKVKPTCLALLSIGDRAPNDDVAFGVDSNMRVIRVLSRLVRENLSWRDVADLCEQTTGLSTAVRWIRSEEDDIDELPSSDENDRKKQEFKQVKDVLVARIRAAADDASLASSPQLLSVLYRWAEWTDDAEPKAYVKRLLETNEGIVTFTRSLLSRRWISNGRKIEVEYKLQVPNQLISVSEIKMALKGLSDEFLAGLNENDRQAIELATKQLPLW